MTYTPLTTTEIETGEPIKNTTLDKIRTDLDDLDSRITNLDLSVANPPIMFSVNGTYQNYVTTGVLKTTINFNLRVTGVYLLIDIAGSGGTTEIDLKFSRAGGAYTSILSTKPAIPYTAGNDAISSSSGTAADINTVYRDLQAGDLLRMDITSAQTAGRNFMVRIDFTKN